MNLVKPRLAVCVTSLAAKQSELKLIDIAIPKLKKYFEVSIYPELLSSDIFDSQSVEQRLRSINWSFDSADIVMAYAGGYNSIELFERFSEIKTNQSSIFIGYSDNTLLVNSLPALNLSRGWLGPMMSNMLKYPEYIDLWCSNIIAWFSNDLKTINQQYNQYDLKVLNSGKMSGKIWGGNCYTFDLLQGTPFCPKFNEPFIYLLEGEDFITDKNRVWQDTIRNFDSIMLQPGAIENLRGLLIGMFPQSYTLNKAELMASIAKRSYLSSVPIVYDFPRGYFQPSLTMPLGEKLQITADKNNTININRI